MKIGLHISDFTWDGGVLLTVVTAVVYRDPRLLAKSGPGTGDHLD